MPEQIVIVGAGQAAIQAADTLRRRGFAGKLIILGEEPWPAYQRPPLSKKYLAGALEPERLPIRPLHFYAEHAIELHVGKRAEELATRDQRIRLDDGTTLPYDRLLLTTGSRPRPLGVPGADLDGVHYLRTIADTDRIRSDLVVGRRLIVIGGGYIGLEVAATARELGLDVTVLEMAERVMKRVTCPEVSSFYEAEHARHGVRIVCNATVRALVGSGGATPGRVRAVLTDEGEYPADTVVVGVGVVPAEELARAAGLACSDGILVDEYCRTSDPAIYAAGDCTSHPSPHYGRRLRLESVDNAFEQGTSAALNVLGTPTVHDRVPWFWSDQYDLKLIIVGVCHGHDAVVLRGDPASRAFSACYLRGGELTAIDTINHPKDQIAARKLIAARARPDLHKLADPRVLLRDSV
jgi:3-phenylpropionate/trans-cinnamate dioxygenase ferredoxin reductase subunit